MDKLLLKLVSLLVDDSSTISIRETPSENVTTFDLTVLPSEYGRVIGREGKVIRAIRSLLALKGTITNRQVLVRLTEVPQS